MLSLMLAVFAFLFEAIMLETGKRNTDNYPENLLRRHMLLGVGGGKESMDEGRQAFAPKWHFCPYQLLSINI